MAPSAFKLASKTALNFTWKKQTLTFYNDELTKWCLKINFLQSSQLKFPSWPHNSIEKIQQEIKNRRRLWVSRECVTFQPLHFSERTMGSRVKQLPTGRERIIPMKIEFDANSVFKRCFHRLHRPPQFWKEERLETRATFLSIPWNNAKNI